MTTKVLIVDDSTFFRKRLAEIIKSDSDLEVIGEAKDGKEGLEKCKLLRPDVITMDVEMPVMDGITAVKEIMKACPTPILMFSSLTYEGANSTFAALEAGAVDFMLKNFDDIAHRREDAFKQLCNSIKAVSRSRVSFMRSTHGALSHSTSSSLHTASSLHSSTATSSLRSSATATRPSFTSSTTTSTTRTIGSTISQAPSKPGDKARDSSAMRAFDKIHDMLGGTDPAKPASAINFTFGNHKGETTVFKRSGKHHDIVMIGSSTGGPIALQNIIPKLGKLKVPLVVVQHMPAAFTTTFAQRLNNISQNAVVELKDGDILEPGTCYIAPGGMQLIFERLGIKTKARVFKGDNRVVYHPCIDVSFASIAQIYGGRVLAMILTGMGSDGCEGCRLLKKKGAVIWAQNEETSVVYGMPQAVVNAGLAEQVLPLDHFASCIDQELS